MTPRLSYLLPDPRTLAIAAEEVADDDPHKALRRGRVMAVVTAAGFRDVLTGCDPDAPFDAVHGELVLTAAGMAPTGRYWTADGTARTFADTEGVTDPEHYRWELEEWTAHLDESNRQVWGPLVTELPEHPDHRGWQGYRLDLAAAAALPLD
ncbi:hypothetical protein ACFV1L_22015 [Kitasatospora sp. NPDC059646]|uniref:hypothetical protein n=1 Tax=Kitasatospora sp. NPDC059646 TaxID=3346893 RepID=UPI0036C94CF1